MFIDWVVGLVFPCQRPMRVQNGILEIAQVADHAPAEATRRTARPGCQASPAAPSASAPACSPPTLVPTYLRNNCWGRDWGGLRLLHQIVPARPTSHPRHRRRRPGTRPHAFGRLLTICRALFLVLPVGFDVENPRRSGPVPDRHSGVSNLQHSVPIPQKL